MMTSSFGDRALQQPVATRGPGIYQKGQAKLMADKHEQFSIAVLDDYQGVALSMADWSALEGRASITIFNDHIADADAVVRRLLPFDIVCVMRERTPMSRAVIERLPKLRLIASTATRNASIDTEATDERGIEVVHTGYSSAPTIELTWALILAGARHLVDENASLRGGGWQRFVGAAVDVFDQEPLPPDHPFRSQSNLLATPHIGYVSRGLYERFYQDTVDNITKWLDGETSP
jgi:phosphoglycerate dehydrogenase-like enzyme